jgi:hypothetical protein
MSNEHMSLAPSRDHRAPAWLPSSRAIVYITLCLGALALFLRAYTLDDELRTDSLLWLDRTDRFWAALSRGQFSKTLLAPHPGVTYMWLHGLCVKLFGADAAEVNHSLVLAAKLPVLVLGTLAATLTFPMLVAILGRGAWVLALLASVLWSTEPYLVVHSRVAHLDMMALAFTWLGLLTLALAYCRQGWKLAIVAGLLFALGCLTKLAMVPIPGTALVLLGVASLLTRFRDPRGIVVAAITGVALLVGVFVFWPALWGHPVETLASVMRRTEEVASNARNDVGYLVGYRATWTPYETALPALFGLVLLVQRGGRPKALSWLCLSFLPYFVIIALAPQKLPRYTLPTFAVTVVLSAVGLHWLYERVRQRWATVAVIALTLLILLRTERVATALPRVAICTSWPTAPPCPSAPANKPIRITMQERFFKEMAEAIAADWRRSGHRKRPRVFCETVKSINRFTRVKPVKHRGHADYVIEWSADYYPPQDPPEPAETAKLGKQVHVLRDGERFVGAAFRGARFPRK